MIVPRGRLARCSSRGDALFCLAGRKFAPAKIVRDEPWGVVSPIAAIGLLSSKIAHSKNFSNPHFLLQNLLVCYLVSSEWTLTLSNSLYSLRSAWSKSGY